MACQWRVCVSGHFAQTTNPLCYHFLIAYGVSANARNRWDNANVRFLGYVPEDDAERYGDKILESGVHEDEREALFHGGFGCLVEFTGRLEDID
jgi:uronate dehydrogenase